ncbi:MAG: Ig family protein [Rhodocyclaceae bacterium]|nr:MAG: Ig family protein [Rhodocyclaceae bacterium]TND06086.1 MAG: Ig family protein [Rhodocyclaceae bacterium]
MPTLIDSGSLFTSAYDLGTLTTPVSISGAVGPLDPSDLFKVTLSSLADLHVSLSSLAAGRDVDVRVLDASGVTVYGRSIRSGNTGETLDIALLDAGDYYIRVTPFDTVGGGLEYIFDLAVSQTTPVQSRIGFQSGNIFQTESLSASSNWVVTVVRVGDTSTGATADWYVPTPTAGSYNPANAADFGGTFPSGTVSFTAGQTTATITLQIAGEGIAEPNENFSIQLSNPSTGAVIASSYGGGNPGMASGMIGDADGGSALPQFSIAVAAGEAADLMEGASGTATPFSFIVTRQGTTVETSTVVWSLAGGWGDSATGSDFVGGVLPGGILTFAPTETSMLITVQVAGDNLVELSDESFNVVLRDPTNATIMSGSASRSIIEDDDDQPNTYSLATAAIGIGSAAYGAIGQGGDKDVYKIILGGGRSYNFVAQPNNHGEGAGLDPILTLLDASGNAVARTNNGGGALDARVGFTAPGAGGVYYLEVSAASGHGTYLLSTRQQGTDDLPGGASTPFTLSPGNGHVPGWIETSFGGEEVDSQLTSLQAGTHYALEFQHPDTYRLEIEVVDRTTGLVVATVNEFLPPHGSPDGYVNRGFEIVAPTTGEYLINVKGTVPGGTLGHYTLNLEALDAFHDSSTAPGSVVGIQAFGTQVMENNTTASTQNFYVYRRGNLETASTVNWTLDAPGGTATTTAGTFYYADTADFTLAHATSGTVSFAAGQSMAFLSFDVNGDVELENVERYSVTLSGAVNSGIEPGGGSAGASIWASDGTPGTITMSTFSIANGSGSVTEGSGTGTTDMVFTVNRTGFTDTATTLGYVVQGSAPQVNGASADVADFLPGQFEVTQTVSFAASQAVAYITVGIARDTEFEAREIYSIRMVPPADSQTAQSNGGASINDDDQGASPYSYTLFRTDVAEGTSDMMGNFFNLSIQRPTATADAVLHWQLLPADSGLSADGSDFFGGVLPGGDISLSAGQTLGAIMIDLAGDEIAEPNESLRLEVFDVTSPSVTMQALPTLNLTILNDDGTYFSILPKAGHELLEGNARLREDTTATATTATPFVFTVNRSGSTDAAASVDWTLNAGQGGGNQATLSDFASGSATTGTVMFTSGQSAQNITVWVQGDYDASERDEGFNVYLTASGNSFYGPGSETWMRIGSDDDAIIGSPSAMASITSGTVTVTAVSMAIGSSLASDRTRIELAGDKDWFKVELSSGATYAFAAASPSGDTLDPVLTLFAADGSTQLAFDDNSLGGTGARLTYTASTAGTYYIEVKDKTGAGLGSYGLTSRAAFGDDFAGDDTTHGELGNHGLVQDKFGFIETPGDHDWYRVNRLSAGLTYNFYLGATQVGAGDATIDLLQWDSGSSTYATVASVSTSSPGELAGGKNYELAYTPTATGEYYISISGPQGMGWLLGVGDIITPSGQGYFGSTMGVDYAIEALAPNVYEGDTGDQAVMFHVYRTGMTGEAGSVEWHANIAGTPPPGVDPADVSDFLGGTLPSGTVYFLPGEAHAVITVHVAGDTLTENNEAFGVELLNPLSSGTLTAGLSYGYEGAASIIRNDDGMAPFLTPAGTPDAAFDTDGKLLTDFSADTDSGRSVVVQPDGKIVVGGNARIGSTDEFALARYNADGSLDTGFGSGGKVTANWDSLGNVGQMALQLQADGKILVGYTGSGLNADFAVTRYNADGTLDTGFGSGGTVLSPVGISDDYGRSIAVQADGKIVLAGSTFDGVKYDFALTRYNANGTLDAGFGSGGTIITPVGPTTGEGQSVAIQADGRIVVAGFAWNGSNHDFALVRYNASGTLDTSFGTGGKVMTVFGTTNDFGYSVAVQADGKILVGGSASNGSNDDFAIARYNADGSLDSSFGSGGKVLVPVSVSGNDAGRSLAVQPDGRIVLTGNAGLDLAVVRLNSDGTLDGSFGTGGKYIVDFGSNDTGYGLAVQADGNIVAAGQSGGDFALVRVHGGGLPDQQVLEGGNFNLTVPANLFTDPNADPLTYSATLADGSPLPAWLDFNPVTRNFSGTPGIGDLGAIDVKLTASDGSFAATDTFALTVASTVFHTYAIGGVASQNEGGARLRETTTGSVTSTPFVYTVVRSGSVETDSTIDWNLRLMDGPGNAANLADFSGTTAGSLSFTASQTAQSLTVLVTGDYDSSERDEWFQVHLSGAGVSLWAPDSFVTSTILSDDDRFIGTATLSTTLTALPIAVGSALSNSRTRIEVAGDKDWYKVELVAGTPYQISATAPSNVGLDPVVALYNAAGTAVSGASNDNSLGGKNALVNFTATTSGAYYFEVKGASTATGQYGISIRSNPTLDDLPNSDETPAELAPTPLGLGRYGVIETAGDSDYVRVMQLSAGVTYTFRLDALNVGAGDANFGLWSVDWPSGTAEFSPVASIAEASTSDTAGKTYLLTTTPTVDGEYFLSVTGPEGMRWKASHPAYPMIGTDVYYGGTPGGFDYAIETVAPNIAEGNTGVQEVLFSIYRNGSTQEGGSVAWQTTFPPGLPTGVDYADASDFFGGVMPSGTVTFAPGEAHQVITVKVAGDTQLESDEGFMVELSNPLSFGTLTASLNSAYSQAGTIIRSEEKTSFLMIHPLLPQILDEGSGGVPSQHFWDVMRSGDLSTVTRVTWTIQPHGASPAAASDFVGATAGIVTFLAGESFATIAAEVAGDDTVEANEDFTVKLVASGGHFYDFAHSGSLTQTMSTEVSTIVNDDIPVAGEFTIQFKGSPVQGSGSFDIPRKAEGGALLREASRPATTGTTPFVFTVTRTDANGGISVVDWQLDTNGWGGHATASDFTGDTAGSVLFTAGQLARDVTIGVVADYDFSEFREWFGVRLYTGGVPYFNTSMPGYGEAAYVDIVSDDDYFIGAASATVGSTTLTAQQGAVGMSFQGGYGALEVAGDQDWIKLELAAGVKYDFIAFKDGDTSTLDPSLRLLAGNGSTVLASDDNGLFAPNARLTYTAPTAGSYYISVQGSGTGEYGFVSSARLGDDYAGSTATHGQLVMRDSGNDAFGTIQTGDDGDWLRVHLDAGTSYTFRSGMMGGTGGNPRMFSLIDGETGTPVTITTAASSTQGAMSEYTLSYTTSGVSGDYYLAIDGGEGMFWNVYLDSSSTGMSTVTAYGIEAIQSNIAEGDTGEQVAYFKIFRDGYTNDTAVVAWHVDTPLPGVPFAPTDSNDFVGGVMASGTVTFAAGEMTTLITVRIAGDMLDEGDEAFSVILDTSPVVSAYERVNVAIRSDDAPAIISVSAPTEVTEGIAYVVTLTRTGNTRYNTVVNWELAAPQLGPDVYPVNSNYVAPSDFTGAVTRPTGTVSFASGATTAFITLATAPDGIIEPDESFTLNYFVTNGLFDGTASTASNAVTLVNNDSTHSLGTPTYIITAPAAKAEGGAIAREAPAPATIGATPYVFTVTRAGNTAESSAVNWKLDAAETNYGFGNHATSNDRATNQPGFGEISFTAGQVTAQLTVNIAADYNRDTQNLNEIDEWFGVILDSGTASARTTIRNDDDRFIGAATAVSGTTTLTAAPQAIGLTRAGSRSRIEFAGDQDWFKVELSAGQTYTFDLLGGPPGSSSSFDPVLKLVTATGSELANGGAASGVNFEEIVYTPTASGSYYLAVQGTGTATGDYTLVTRSADMSDGYSNDSSTTARLVSATNSIGRTGRIDSTGDQDWMSLTLDSLAATNYTITYTALAQQRGDTVSFTVWDNFATGTLAPPTVLTATAAGQWLTGTVSVDANNADDFVAVSGSQGVLWNARVTATAGGESPNSASVTTYGVESYANLVEEGNANATGSTAGVHQVFFNVYRTGLSNEAGSVDWWISSSDVSAADFIGATSGTVFFSAGEANQNAAVFVSGDALDEGNEAFDFQLSNAVYGTAAAALHSTEDSARVTILDDERNRFSIAAVDARRLEGSPSGTSTVTSSTPFVFAVSRAGLTTGTATVEWNVAGGDVSADDFTAGSVPSGTLTFDVGQSIRFLTIGVAADSNVEDNEDFTVTLSNALVGAGATATIVVDSADGAILNDDRLDRGASTTGLATAVLTLPVATTEATTVISDFVGASDRDDYYQIVLNEPGNLKVTLSDLGSNANLRLLLADGSTLSSSNSGTQNEFIAKNGLAVGTYYVHVQQYSGDTEYELEVKAEQFSAGAAPDVYVFPAAADRGEGNTGSTPFVFTVMRSGDLSSSSKVQWNLAGNSTTLVPGTASANDFAGATSLYPSGTLTFAANVGMMLLTVNAAGDTTAEGDEGFRVNLTGIANANIAIGSVDAVIRNDDAIQDQGGNSLALASDRGFLGVVPQQIDDYVGSVDGNDYYRIKLASASDLRLQLTGLRANANIELLPGAGGSPVAVSAYGGAADEVIALNGVAAGTYVVRVYAQTGADTNYTLRMSALPPLPTLGIVANTPALSEGASATTTPFTFTINRTGDLSREGSVSWRAVATLPNVNDDDFVGDMPEGSVSFSEGQSSAIITVDVAGDGDVELDETFLIELHTPLNVSLSATQRSAAAVIVNDDRIVPPPALVLQSGSAFQAEGSAGTTATYTFTVIRAGDVEQLATASTVEWVVDSRAPGLNEDDFVGGVLPAGTVSFATGAATATITVQVAGDNIEEANEAFAVRLTEAEWGQIIGGADTAVALILNDDVPPPPAVVAIEPLDGLLASVFKAEGTSSVTTDYVYNIVRTAGDNNAVVNLTWQVEAPRMGGATGDDFFGGVLPSGTFTLPAFVPSGTVTMQTAQLTIQVAGDATVEFDEAFFVRLTGAEGGLIDRFGSTSLGLIVNDDVANRYLIEAFTPSLDEGSPVSDTTATDFTFTVTRAGDTSGAGTIGWSVIQLGVGVTADDFFGGAIPSGTVSFDAGSATAMITISVAQDTLQESNEVFAVRLDNPSTGGELDPFDSVAVATIQNDDTTATAAVVPTVSIEALTASLDEGNAAGYDFVLSRVGGLTGTSVVRYAVTSGQASVNGADFVESLTGTVSFAIGDAAATIHLSSAEDSFFESDESFQVNLTSVSNVLISASAGQAVATIENDDLPATVSVLLDGSTAAEQFEGNNTAGAATYKFVVSRDPSADLSLAGTVKWTLGGADAGLVAADFSTPITGIASFSTGATTAVTVTVKAFADTVQEANESFFLELSDPVNMLLDTGNSRVDAVIKNDDSPAVISINASDASKQEGSTLGASGFTNFVFQVTRDGSQPASAITAKWTVSSAGNSGLTAGDFFGNVLPSGTVTLGIADTVKEITVKVASDLIQETDEAFKLTLSDARNATVSAAGSVASGNIVNDDGLPRFSISPQDLPLAEANVGSSSSYVFTVTRSEVVGIPYSVNWFVTDVPGGASANAADFVGGILPSGTLSFASAETTKTITVKVAGDTLSELDETFALSVVDFNGVRPRETTAVGRILNSDDDAGDNAAAALTLSSTLPPPTFYFNSFADGHTDVDWFKLSLTSGFTYRFALVSPVAGARLDVRDASGDSLADSDSRDNWVVATPGAGTFYLVAGNSLEKTGTYNIVISRSVSGAGSWPASGSVSTTATLALNTVPASGFLEADGDVQYKVSLTAGTAYNFAAHTPTGGATALSFNLYGTPTATATALATASVTSGAEWDDAALSFTPATSGTYYLDVAGTADELYQVEGAPANYAPTTATLAISSAQASLAEGSSIGGQTPFVFNVARRGATQNTVTVRYETTVTTVAGQANATDFFGGSLPAGTLTFAPGELFKAITIMVAQDQALEGDEAFSVKLTNPAGATLATASASASIRNDDTAPTIAVAAMSESLPEGDSGYSAQVFRVSRSGAVGGESKVNWSIAGATATGIGAAAATDFVGGVLPTGTLTFAANQTEKFVTVLVTGDTTVEGNEAFDLVLASPTGASLDTSATRARAVITNDDVVAPTLVITTLEGSKSEGNSATSAYTFSIERIGDTSKKTVAVWGVTRVIGGAAVSDFAGGVLPAGTVTMAAGISAVTVTVNVAGDTNNEVDEAFRVKILQATNGVVGSVGGTAIGNIRNDDNIGAVGVDSTRIDLAGNTRDLAYDVGVIGSTTRNFSDFVGNADKNDYYRFVTTARGKLQMNLTGLTPDSDIQLLSSTGSFIAGSAQAGVTPENLVIDNLEAGTYYVRAYQFLGNINYTLKLTSTANADNAGDTFAAARNVGALGANEMSYSDYVGGADKDYYVFTTTSASSFRLTMAGDSPNADVRLLDGSGQIITPDNVGGGLDSSSSELISVSNLAAGKYYVWVYPASGTINYTVRMSATPTSQSVDSSVADEATYTLSSTVMTTVSNAVGDADAADYFKIVTTQLSNLRANLTGLGADADLVLLQSDRTTPIAYSTNAGNSAESVGFDNLAAGTYYIKVAQQSGSTTYNLTMAATAPNPTDGAGNVFTAAKPVSVGPTPLVVTEAIGYGTDTVADWYSFVLPTTTVAADYVFNLGLAGMSANADVELYQRTAAGTTIAALTLVNSGSTAGAADEAFTANLSAGTYYVQVDPAVAGEKTAYNLSLQAYANRAADNNDSTGTAGSMNVGTVAAPTITATSTATTVTATAKDFVGVSDRDDYFQFVLETAAGTTANYGVNVTLALAGLGAGSNADLELLDSTGAVVALSNAGGVTAENIAVNGLVAGSAYYAHVLQKAGESNYTLTLTSKIGTAPTDAAGNSAGAAKVVTLTSVASSYADYFDDTDSQDWYRFSVATASNLRARVQGLSADADLTLYESDGTTIRGQQTIASPNGLFAADGLTAGTYYVKASQTTAGTHSNYSLSLAAGADDYRATTATTGTFTATTATVTGAIEAAGDIDWIGVSLTTGTWIVRQQGTGTTGKLGDALIYGIYGDPDADTTFALMPGTSNDDADGTTKDARAVFNVTTEGTYYIAAAGYGNATGSYSVTLSDTNQSPVVVNPMPDQSAPEGHGFTVRLPWNTFGDPDGQNLTLTWANQQELVDAGVTWLSFDATARLFVATSVPTAAPDIVVRVQASDGSLVTSDDFVIRTPAAGDDFAATTATTGSVAAGSFARGNINAPGDVDWFSVVLTNGDSYSVDLRGASSALGTLVDPVLLGLYDSSGVAVSSDVARDYIGTESRLNYSATASGTYYIAASGQGSESGTYAISLSSGSNAVPVLDGTAYTASIANADSRGVRYLEAREGTAFRFQLPSDLFTDAESGQLTYTATLGDGKALPSWLTFNAATRTFTGTPPAAGNDLDIRIAARDPLGQFAATDFTLRTPPPANLPNAKWTVMVYVDADSNQAPYALKDLNELESVLMPSGVNVVVMWDSSGAADTKRGRLTYDTDMQNFKSVLTAVAPTERNMGDPATLTEFIDWGASNYRADNYALVVWDRNGGGLTGMGVDFTSGRASLSASELNRAIDNSTIGQVDLLGFDSNLAANIELVTEVANQADFVVGTEALSKADGWDYAGWLLQLAANPNMTDAQLATAAQDSYFAYYGNNAATTLQGATSSQVSALTTALGAFVTAAADMSGTERTAIQAAVSANRLQGDASLVDLRGLATTLDADAAITGDIETAAQQLVTELNNQLGSGSLSVFVAGNAGGAAAADYNAGNYRFVADSDWKSFNTTLFSS